MAGTTQPAVLRDAKILIVGCGSWGSSTALELGRRQYKHVTVLDSHTFPSAIAAGNDINKIVEQGMPSR
jgi:sarcosine oxidase/L-pipecolate oxidase